MNKTPKQLAAEYIAKYHKNVNYMILGSGSTINEVINQLPTHHSNINKLRVVSASSYTSEKLRKYSIQEISIEAIRQAVKPNNIICIDGADQISFDENNEVNGILKGHGAALVREKLLWKESDDVYVVVDETKICDRISKYIPIEVTQSTLTEVTLAINQLYHEVKLNISCNSDGSNLITDNGNNILEVHHDQLDLDIQKFNKEVLKMTGIVDTGIFETELIKKCKFVIGYPNRVEFID